MVELLTKTEVCDLLKVTYPMVWRMMLENGFPRSIEIGPNSPRWIKDEVMAWLAERPRRQLKTDK